MTKFATHGRQVGAALLCLAVAGCGSSTSPSSVPLANGTFTALINGANFSATSAKVVTSAPLVSIGGGNASGQTIGFAWLDGGPGTYAIGGATIATHTLMGNTWSASSAQGSGSITVTTSTSNRVAGTFSFVLQADGASGAAGTRNITQGRFDLTF